MDKSENITTLSIAFLEAASFNDEGGKAFRGGILVTDSRTYPLEFRLTTPIRPTPLQVTLYGRTLKEYIYVDLVALTLLQSIKSKPAFVFVASEYFLKARPKVNLPIFWIGEGGSIKSHPRYKEELRSASEAISKLNGDLLLEAFSRVRAALLEAHRQRIGEK